MNLRQLGFLAVIVLAGCGVHSSGYSDADGGRTSGYGFGSPDPNAAARASAMGRVGNAQAYSMGRLADAQALALENYNFRTDVWAMGRLDAELAKPAAEQNSAVIAMCNSMIATGPRGGYGGSGTPGAPPIMDPTGGGGRPIPPEFSGRNGLAKYCLLVNNSGENVRVNICDDNNGGIEQTICIPLGEQRVAWIPMGPHIIHARGNVVHNSQQRWVVRANNTTTYGSGTYDEVIPIP